MYGRCLCHELSSNTIAALRSIPLTGYRMNCRLFRHVIQVVCVCVKIYLVKVSFSAGSSAEILSVSGFQDVVQTSSNSFVAPVVVSKEIHGNKAVAATVDILFICDFHELVLAVDLHDLDDAWLAPTLYMAKKWVKTAFDQYIEVIIHYNEDGSAVKPVQIQLVTDGEYHSAGTIDDMEVIDPANYQ